MSARPSPTWRPTDAPARLSHDSQLETRAHPDCEVQVARGICSQGVGGPVQVVPVLHSQPATALQAVALGGDEHGTGAPVQCGKVVQ